MSDMDKVRDICKRLERTLQRDWGGAGEGMTEKLKSTKYVVPPHLYKRIRYLSGLQKKAAGNKHFKLKSSEDFAAKGEQVIQDLAQARKTASRRLLPWLKELAAKHRVILGAAVAVLVAVLALLYFTFEPEPIPAPVATPVRKPAPKPAPRPVPKPPAKAPAPATTAARAPAPATQALAPASAPATAPAAIPAGQAAPAPAPLPAGTTVYIEAPSEVVLTLKRAELIKGASGRDEIAVIVEVRNMGYGSLKRITFDAWLYDTSGPRPVAVIVPSAPDATPWYAFLRLAIKRGQGSEVRLNYSTTSKWSTDQAIKLVKSGRYQIRLKAVSLTDGSDKPLPLGPAQ